MLVITEISAQVKRSGYYNVFINGKYVLSLSELDLASSEIKINQQIDEKKLKELKDTHSKSKSYNFAIRYLALRPRSIEEVKQYLLIRRGFNESDVEYTVQKLIAEKYLNDYDFAEMWVRNRMLLAPKSEKVLRLELCKKGVDRSIIDEVLSALGDDEKQLALMEIINKKLRQSKYKDKQKLTEYLARQGYNYNLIKKTFEELALFEN